MRYSQLFSVLLLACLPFAGCDDDQSGSGGNSNQEKIKPADACNPATFTESCIADSSDPSKLVRQICKFSPEDLYSRLTNVTCADNEVCKVYDGKSHCAEICTNETETTQSCRVDIVDGAQVPVSVSKTCRRFEDGNNYFVEEETPCNGFCYNNKCTSVGEQCTAKTSDKNSVIGCNKSDVYVCSEDQTIHKLFCPDNKLCQKTSDDYYYCSEKCSTPSTLTNKKTCSFNGNRLVSMACTAVSDTENYYLSPEGQATTGSSTKYCKNDALHSYPGSVSCSGKCTELCYGNNALPWLYSGQWGYVYCGVGLCAHFDDKDGRGYDTCMQPCDVEGEEISKCGAYLDTDNHQKRSVYECTRYDNGLYYAVVEVESCSCYDGRCL